jgi:rhodanese-related sulfurtransferase
MKQPLEIDIHTVHKMQESQEEFLLIDCREQSEFDTCRIEGCTLIPMKQTMDHLEKLAAHKDKPIVVY